MKTKKNKKGFTLAELLIVVAIIAVLVAIAIPVFTQQLEKSRDSASLSNIRSAYAQAQASVVSNAYVTDMTNPITEGHVTINSGFDFGEMTGTVAVTGVKIETQAASNDWSGLLPTTLKEGDLTFPGDTGKTIAGENKTVTFTYSKSDAGVTEISAAIS